MSDQLHYLSLDEVSNRIRSGGCSSEEVTLSELERIKTLDSGLRSFSEVLPQAALTDARRADDELKQGIWRGPLHGVPIAVKDLLDVKGSPSACGMTLPAEIASEDATAVSRLRDAGAIILGKLNMTEGASLVHHPEKAVPDNPWGVGSWAGVSSSGAGSAIAAGLCYGALGSDTGGSIRMPSAACGLSGLKPTWGRVSRHGVHPLAESFDHVGPMARSVIDLALILGVISGQDEQDPTTLVDAVPNYLHSIGAGVEKLRVGYDPKLLEAFVTDSVAACFQDSLSTFSDLGATLVEVSLPALHTLSAEIMPLVLTEAAAAHLATFPDQASRYGPHLAGFLAGGHAQSGLEVVGALKARAAFRGIIRASMSNLDVVLTPTLPFETPSQAEMLGDESDRVPLLYSSTLFTFPASVAQLPALTIPMGFGSKGLPVGLQLIGGDLQEGLLMRVGHAFQTVTAFHKQHPSL